MKICRNGNDFEKLFEDAKETSKSIKIEQMCDEFYSHHPDLYRNSFLFMQIEDEFVWRFRHHGYADVFFPMDRLPVDLEKFLKDKTE